MWRPWKREARPRLAEPEVKLPSIRHAPVKVAPGGFAQRKASALPFVTADQLREIQRGAIDHYHIDALQITENAGRAASRMALAMLGGKARGQRVVVLAGGGSIGASGLAAVRHLTNWGVNAEPIFGAILEEMLPTTRRHVEILRASGMHELSERNSSEESLRDHLQYADLIIDAIGGYGLVGPPVGIAAAVTELAVESGRPILSMDVPTGIDATTGKINTPAIRAATTLLLDLPKLGMLADECRSDVGELFLADIGVPVAAHEQAGIRSADIFSDGPIVRIRR